MSCSSPIAWEDLVAYWAGDLTPADVDRIDEHVMGCESCARESERLSTLVEALRGFIPPVVTRAAIDGLRARGLNVVENTFEPNDNKTAVFSPGVDLLIHHLRGLDLTHAKHVRVTVRVQSTGDVLFEDPDAPFDARDGVLISCQRHYAAFPSDTIFEVRAIDPSGAETVAVYSIPHVF